MIDFDETPDEAQDLSQIQVLLADTAVRILEQLADNIADSNVEADPEYALVAASVIFASMYAD